MSRLVLLFKPIDRLTLTGSVLFLLSILFFSHPVSANTLLTDFTADVGIEIGDTELDFRDEPDTIEKGRFITYQINVQNSGNSTHHGIAVLMDTPRYMHYVPGSSFIISGAAEQPVLLDDVNNISPLEMGFFVDDFAAGELMRFTIQFQVDTEILDDEVYTLAWANVLDKFSSIPLVSNLVENRILGEAAPAIQVNVVTTPEPESAVNAGFPILYNYTIRNVGGISEGGVSLITYLPANTTCIEGCGSVDVGTLGPNEYTSVLMRVEVNADYGTTTTIENTGYDISGATIGKVENRTPIIHFIDSAVVGGEGDFIVEIVQEPNIILNSADGVNARYDGADLTETLYSLTYLGRHKSNTFPEVSPSVGTTINDSHCGSYTYPNAFGATTYAYNSSGGGCDNISSCPPISSPIVFKVDTILPDNAPKLLFTVNTPSYAYGSSPEVNAYMKNGSTIPIPRIFTQSRAVENGAMGIVASTVDAQISEDLYRYENVGSTLWCTYSTCSKTTCTPHPVPRPIYEWRKASSESFTLTDTDNTDVTVYTSTAWLKTEGGHLGSNDRFTNDIYTESNYVDLGLPAFSDYLTPSSLYTPPGETNSEYLIFGKAGTGSFKSEAGELWNVDGSEFPFVQRGDAYDHTDNPRDYYSDMFDREKFGDVKEGTLPSALSGRVELGDNTIWRNTDDIIIGTAGVADTVVFAGGRSRIYTEGDVYINANIKYGSSQGKSYSDITSVRIDARNIYVNGEVTELEVMLLARDTFRSGVSMNQLRILGDVIANQSIWERQPLKETNPTEFNKPSEYIIEDMRKYVVPPPGDTEIPDDYNVWRQVNPSTGEVLDGY